MKNGGKIRVSAVRLSPYLGTREIGNRWPIYEFSRTQQVWWTAHLVCLTRWISADEADLWPELIWINICIVTKECVLELEYIYRNALCNNTRAECLTVLLGGWGIRGLKKGAEEIFLRVVGHSVSVTLPLFPKRIFKTSLKRLTGTHTITDNSCGPLKK